MADDEASEEDILQENEELQSRVQKLREKLTVLVEYIDEMTKKVEALKNDFDSLDAKATVRLNQVEQKHRQEEGEGDG